MVRWTPSRATAFAVFDRQDSGCVSYGIERDGRRTFVKTATTDAARASLGRAIAFHAAVRHPAIVAPLAVVDTSAERTLVYPWCDGEVLNHATIDGSDRSALHRFRALATPQIVQAIDTVLDAHLAVAAAGFVSVDLYDGCFLYDFEGDVLRLIDLDEYRPGPFVVEGPRLPGSIRYMAPEEHVRAATVDERTTVFHLGRVVEQLLGLDRCSPQQREVVQRAVQGDPADRFPTVAGFVDRWRAAGG